jgi:hypothetical protein
MSSCLSREAGPLRAAVVAQISSNPAAQNDGVTSSPEPPFTLWKFNLPMPGTLKG